MSLWYSYVGALILLGACVALLSFCEIPHPLWRLLSILYTRQLGNEHAQQSEPTLDLFPFSTPVLTLLSSRKELFSVAGSHALDELWSRDWACFSKVPQNLRARKPFVKLRSPYSLRLVLSYVVKGIKIKITVKFRASRRLRFGDTEIIMSLEFWCRTFEKEGSGDS